MNFYFYRACGKRSLVVGRNRVKCEPWEGCLEGPGAGSDSSTSMAVAFVLQGRSIKKFETSVPAISGLLFLFWPFCAIFIQEGSRNLCQCEVRILNRVQQLFSHFMIFSRIFFCSDCANILIVQCFHSNL